VNFHAIPASFRFMRKRFTNESPNFMPSARAASIAAVVLMLAACATPHPVPVEDRAAAPPPPPPAAAPVAPPPAPAAEPEARAQTYTVKSGDTLAKIALDNGLDYRELAGWNNLDNPNLIRVGQVLRLTAPSGTAQGASATAATTTPLRPATATSEARPVASTTAAAAPPSSTRGDGATKSSPKALREPYSEQAVREVALAGSAAAAAPPPAVAVAPPKPATTANDTVALATPPGPRADAKAEPANPAAPDAGDDDRIDWAWPVKGKVVGGFSESANLKGIDIAGNAGQPVFASAPGRVVYAGSGLRGYGKLIIIKHNKTYLSAYAHNREILVKEGDQVAKGQKIAEMGNTDTDQVKLHFEIRRMGKPMDPTRYLPPA
jgi:lipoprotein NlpD